MLFLKKVKKPIDNFVLEQKKIIYVWVDTIFANILKISFLGLFELS